MELIKKEGDVFNFIEYILSETEYYLIFNNNNLGEFTVELLNY